MDTITINANDAPNNEEQNKMKCNISKKSKVAMAAGVTGMVTGFGAKAVADAMLHDSDDNATADAEYRQTVAEDETTMATEETIAKVNPDEVMLEEPIAEISAETDMIAEAVAHPVAEDDYRPFSSNDRITEDVPHEPQPEDVLLAENTEVEVASEGNSAVDLICGVPEQEETTPEDAVYHEDDLYADNGPSNNDYDVQSDLMA
jgi:hypothetical protein